MKKIGVFTSGGDSPGMNAAVRAVTRTAIYEGLEVIGIRRGYEGMIDGDFQEMNRRSVANIIQRGGTFLKTARSEKFITPEGRQKAFEALHNANIDGLVCIGGDGSYMGAHLLNNEHGIACVGIPGTIDNDLYGTDFTIGFDTAINTAVEAIDRIRDTADSHNRVFLVEVMGKDAGYIALDSGIAGGAEGILIPEDTDDTGKLFTHFDNEDRRTKSFSIIIIAEGDEDGGTFNIAQKLKDRYKDIKLRVTILGHIQRGGNPTAKDRILASTFGYEAVKALISGETSSAIGIVDHKPYIIPLYEASTRSTVINTEKIRMADILST